MGVDMNQILPLMWNLFQSNPPVHYILELGMIVELISPDSDASVWAPTNQKKKKILMQVWHPGGGGAQTPSDPPAQFLCLHATYGPG